MKRLDTTATILRQANRAIDPLTGRVLETGPQFDLSLLPRLDWPVSPALQSAVASAVNDAIALQLSFTDATASVARALSKFGIQLAPDELLAVVRSNALGAI
jgi:hypothetical protein